MYWFPPASRSCRLERHDHPRALKALHDEWNSYLTRLSKNLGHLNTRSRGFFMLVCNPRDGSFTAKLGYKSWQEERKNVQPHWWWKTLWKSKAPLRCKILMWLALTNKLLTWDNLEKRNWHGPNHCILCKQFPEYVSHLFISCPFAGQVASTLKENLKIGADWNFPSLEECYKLWIHDRSLKLYAGLPCILVANLWWAQNVVTIKDKWMTP
jgi:hypothetical protein